MGDFLENIGFLSDIRNWRGTRMLLEDGFKFLGIISWLTYYTKVGITSLKSTSLRQSPDRATTPH